MLVLIDVSKGNGLTVSVMIMGVLAFAVALLVTQAAPVPVPVGPVGWGADDCVLFPYGALSKLDAELMAATLTGAITEEAGA